MTQGADDSLTVWFDPVCPFTWNTARWLKSVADGSQLSVDWRLMSLAVLNEGQESSQGDKMRDSRRAGRLMAAIAGEYGAEALVTAYFAFGHWYFDGSGAVDEGAVAVVSNAIGNDIPTGVISDESYDEAVRLSHQAGQDALGDGGGSPILQISGRAFFGPVLTAPPTPQMATTLYEAIAALAAIPEFSELKR